uniref:SAM domain-containing protein n=1 Tax=Macrostomum lignano TaxID=282301 RepID=A0A1I8F484_9PLAT
VPLAKLELALARLGYRFTAGELAELRNSVGGGGSLQRAVRSVRGRAVSDIIGRRSRSSGHLGGGPTFAAAPSIRRLRSPRQTGRRRQRRGEATAVCRCYVDIDWLADCADRPGQDAAVAAAKSEARELRPVRAALQRRLDDAEAAIERDRRRLAVLAGELRKSGRHSNRLATALQATLDLLGRLANLDQAERAEADAVAERAAELLSNEGFDGNERPAARLGAGAAAAGGAEAAAAVFANHAEARQPPAAGNSKRAEQEAEPEVDGPKRLQRYRMDILDRNGVPRLPLRFCSLMKEAAAAPGEAADWACRTGSRTCALRVVDVVGHGQRDAHQDDADGQQHEGHRHDHPGDSLLLLGRRAGLRVDDHRGRIWRQKVVSVAGVAVQQLDGRDGRQLHAEADAAAADAAADLVAAAGEAASLGWWAAAAAATASSAAAATSAPPRPRDRRRDRRHRRVGTVPVSSAREISPSRLLASHSLCQAGAAEFSSLNLCGIKVAVPQSGRQVGPQFLRTVW